MTAKDRKALAEIAYALDAAARIVSVGKDFYDDDERARLASEAIISRIGEAAGRLSEPFLAAHPDVSWKAIRGMRNLVSHQYQIISYDRVWDTMAIYFPALRAELHADLPTPPAPIGPKPAGRVCGRIVASTGLRCRLTAAHRGHCRSK